MTDDLAAWLLACIAGDEQIARLASPGPWSTESGLHVLDKTGEHAPVRQAGSFEDGWHIARWDPARVLAECDAKQQIIAEHSVVYVPPPGSPYPVNDSCPVCEQLPCLTLRLLALPFADRPGYREAWKP